MSDLVKKDLGTVSAYKYAKLHGYTGTEDEFGVLMASYASVAQEASRSATDAGTKAKEAKQSAQSASEAAQTATDKASEAVTAAGTSTTKASEASTSADTASAAATSASTSAQTATTAAATATAKASEASESAATATTAKTDAESARDAAAQSASEAAASAESIDPDEFNRKIYAAFATDTVTGAVASFPDGADDIPLKSCIVQIEPVQDLHGYDSPWPAGGGKNILPTMTNETESRNGVTFTRNANGSISMSGTMTAAAAIVFVEFTLSAGNYTFSNIGSNASSTGAYADFYIRNLDTAETLAYIRYNTPADNKDFTLTKTTNIRFYTIVQKGATISGTIYPMIRLSTVTDSTYAPYENICPITGWTGATVKHSGADTSNPTTYPITFPSEAGTVYGGTLDVTKGVLVVDRGYYTVTNATTLRSEGTYTDFTQWTLSQSGDIVAGKPNGAVISNVFVHGTLVKNGIFCHGNNGTLNITPQLSIGTAGQEVLAWLIANNVQFCYELATPITYTLTPQEITSLLGQNNIWADTGDVNVEYRADTRLYIEKLTQPEENDMIADSAISEGRFFMIGNSLYRALANIASGATITVGTNTQRVSLSDALNLVNA